MQQFRLIFAVFVFALGPNLLLHANASSQQRHKIEGIVLDKDNKPLSLIWVRIYRGIEQINDDITGQDGRYELEYNPGEPISIIRYDDLRPDNFERRHPAIVNNISGNQDHIINKIMPDKVGFAYGQEDLLEILSAYERLYVLDTAANVQNTRRDIFDRYPNNLQMMKPVDSITEQRLQQVLDLYSSSFKGATPAEVNAWVPYGLKGKWIRALAIAHTHPSTLYANVFGSIFMSSTSEARWREINSGLLGDIAAFSIAPITPTTIYAGGSDPDGSTGMVVKSTNGGESWQDISRDQFNSPVSAIAAEPAVSSTLYVATEAGQLLKSTNGGKSWQVVIDYGEPINAIVIDPTTPSTLYAGREGTIAKSTDGGESWRAIGISNARDPVALALDPITPTILYAGIDADVYKSTDGGEHWRALKLDKYYSAFTALAIDPTTPSTVYSVNSSDGVYKSLDGGESWHTLNTGLDKSVYYNGIFALAIDPITPSTLYVATDYGVWTIEQTTLPPP